MHRPQRRVVDKIGKIVYKLIVYSQVGFYWELYAGIHHRTYISVTLILCVWRKRVYQKVYGVTQQV